MPKPAYQHMLRLGQAILPGLSSDAEDHPLPLDPSEKVEIATYLLLSYAEVAIARKLARRHKVGTYVHAHKGRRRRRHCTYVKGPVIDYDRPDARAIAESAAMDMAETYGETVIILAHRLYEEVVANWIEIVDDFVELRV